MLLVGDIGGTKTVLALFSPERGPHEPLVEATFASRKYDSLEAIVDEFLTKQDVLVQAASFGIAGPVLGRRVKITNLPWVIDSDELAGRSERGLVLLMNDLVATANAIPILEPGDIHVINEGQAVPEATIGVLAPGTGLGMGYLTWDGAGYKAHPSEGGHADFSPSNALEVALLNYLYDKYDHVSTERVCSGSGIPNIYNFLRDTGRCAEPDWLAEALAAADDPTPIIMNTAMKAERPCDICELTLDTFVDLLAAEAGDMALVWLATGGMYLGGGIPPRIVSRLDTDHFREAFWDKGRFTSLLQQVPVRVITNPRAALLGAARAGLATL